MALRVGDPAQRALGREAARLAALAPGMRPVRAEDVHLTVQFLGPTPEDRVPALVAALLGASAGVSPVVVRYEGLGAFPTAARARVLWAGVVEPAGEGRLAALAGRVARALEPLGYPGEDRPYHPHVTLGRAAGRLPGRLATLLRRGPGDPPTYGTETLSDLALMVSAPGSDGARYRALATFRLTAPALTARSHHPRPPTEAGAPGSPTPEEPPWSPPKRRT